MRALGLALLIVVLVGCSKSPPVASKSLAGDWKGTDEHGNPFFMAFGQDGTYSILVPAGEGGAGAEGTFTLEGADLRYIQKLGPTNAAPHTVKVTWTGKDAISLSDQGHTTTLIRTGPARKSGLLADSEPTAEQSEPTLQGSCVSNLKQIGLATSMYIQDYDQTLMPSANWNAKLNPYLKNGLYLTCPALKREHKVGGYALDSRSSGTFLKDVEKPASAILYYESSTESLGATDPLTSLLSTSRHDGKVNVTFVDGHAAPKP